jgi:tripeptide aminopeptidase
MERLKETLQAFVVGLFLEMAVVNTRSIPEGPSRPRERKPSSVGQTLLAAKIVDWLIEMGVPRECVWGLSDGSVFVDLPATPGYEKAPRFGLMAHKDTCEELEPDPDPQIRTYNGETSVLLGEGVELSGKDLAGLKPGDQYITGTGKGNIGADDKAGIAAILGALRTVLMGGLPHGVIRIWFTPDEEIGEVDPSVLPDGVLETTDIWWSPDGEATGLVDVGCFWGRNMTVTFKGHNVHPGTDGPDLKPAHYAAAEFIMMTARAYPTPMQATGDQSYCYAYSIPQMDAEQAVVKVIPRSFDDDESREMIEGIGTLAERCAHDWGCEMLVETKNLYGNYETAVDAHFELVQPGFYAHTDCGYEVTTSRARGGSIGSFIFNACGKPSLVMGIGAGGIHGKKERVNIREMVDAARILTAMIGRYAKLRIHDAH